MNAAKCVREEGGGGDFGKICNAHVYYADTRGKLAFGPIKRKPGGNGFWGRRGGAGNEACGNPVGVRRRRPSRATASLTVPTSFPSTPLIRGPTQARIAADSEEKGAAAPRGAAGAAHSSSRPAGGSLLPGAGRGGARSEAGRGWAWRRVVGGAGEKEKDPRGAP